MIVVVVSALVVGNGGGYCGSGSLFWVFFLFFLFPVASVVLDPEVGCGSGSYGYHGVSFLCPGGCGSDGCLTTTTNYGGGCGSGSFNVTVECCGHVDGSFLSCCQLLQCNGR